MGFLQARILEWVSMPSSGGFCRPSDRTQVSVSPALADRFFTTNTTTRNGEWLLNGYKVSIWSDEKNLELDSDAYQQHWNSINMIKGVNSMLMCEKWKWKSLSHVRLFVTQWTAACQAPLFMGILQARILEWVSVSFWPGDLSNPEIEPRSPALQADSLPAEPPGKSKNTGLSSISLLQEIFLTQESNGGLLHCRQILYKRSYQGNPLLMCTVL